MDEVQKLKKELGRLRNKIYELTEERDAALAELAYTKGQLDASKMIAQKWRKIALGKGDNNYEE